MSSSVPALTVVPVLATAAGSASKPASASSTSSLISVDAGLVAESVAARLVRQIAERHADIRRLEEERNARDEALLLRLFG